MEWFVFAMISVGTLALSNLLQRVLMKDKKSDPVTYGLTFQFICAFLIALFALWKGFVMPPISEFPFNFALMAIAYGTSTILLFNALKSIEASEAVVLTSTRAFWIIIFAVLFLGEIFTAAKLLGTLLIFASIFLVSYKKGMKLKKGSIYALAFAFFFGIAITNDAFIIQRSDVPSYLVFGFLLPNFVILAYKPSAVKKMKIFLNRKLFTRMLLMSLFYSISAISFYLAYQSGGDISQVAPINQSVVIVTVILAAIFLKERRAIIRKLIAAFLVTVGVLLLL